jgi:hypothetical protein
LLLVTNIAVISGSAVNLVNVLVYFASSITDQQHHACLGDFTAGCIRAPYNIAAPSAPLDQTPRHPVDQ